MKILKKWRGQPINQYRKYKRRKSKRARDKMVNKIIYKEKIKN